jgi:hypothetical protein
MGIVVPPDRSPETDPDREEAERELEAYHPRPWWPSLMIRSCSSSTSSRATGELISYNLELTRVPPPSIVAVVCFRRDQAGPNQANRVECDGGATTMTMHAATMLRFVKFPSVSNRPQQTVDG